MNTIQSDRVRVRSLSEQTTKNEINGSGAHSLFPFD
jgi:hypothetical protein